MFAGYDSTAVTVDAGVVLLSRHREQWELLRGTPSAVPGAVAEILRLAEADAPEGLGFPRCARERLDVDGVVIEPGEAVLLDVARANLTGGSSPIRCASTRAARPTRNCPSGTVPGTAWVRRWPGCS